MLIDTKSASLLQIILSSWNITKLSSKDIVEQDLMENCGHGKVRVIKLNCAFLSLSFDVSGSIKWSYVRGVGFP